MHTSFVLLCVASACAYNSDFERAQVVCCACDVAPLLAHLSPFPTATVRAHMPTASADRIRSSARLFTHTHTPYTSPQTLDASVTNPDEPPSPFLPDAPAVVQFCLTLDMGLNVNQATAFSAIASSDVLNDLKKQLALAAGVPLSCGV